LLNANPAALQSSSAETCDIVDADDPMARGTYRYRRGAVMAPPSLHLQIFRSPFALVWNVFRMLWLGPLPSLEIRNRKACFFAARHKR
jgi:hypothetical protein